VRAVHVFAAVNQLRTDRENSVVKESFTTAGESSVVQAERESGANGSRSVDRSYEKREAPGGASFRCGKELGDYARSNRSAFITLFQALTKSFTNFSFASA
jgi:hypothetical protein